MAGIKTDMRHFADLFFCGGPIYTVDPRGTVASACAVRGERIIGTGREAELLHLVGPATEIVDLSGRCLVPGLIDAHSHILSHGLARHSVDCKQGVSSIEDIVARVRAAAASRPAGKWIAGRGYDQNKLAEGRHPDRRDLDRAAPGHPVVLTRTCGHIVACNSRALELAGIDARTPDPDGGEIVRDAAGEPTGVLKEAAARPLWAFLATGLEAQRQAYLEASAEYLSLGITSTHDASGGDRLQLRAMAETHLAGQPAVRTYMMLRGAPPGEGLPAPGDLAVGAGLITGIGCPGLRLGPVKFMVDGSSSGPTAATREPYASQPESRGIVYFDQEALSRSVGRAAGGGFQVTAHCVGDRAVEMMLRAYEGLAADAAVGGGAGDPPAYGAPARRRDRIEHCAMLDQGLIATIKRLGVVPVANPCFLWEFGDGYLRDYGPERAGRMFPLRSLLAAGVPVAAGSDAPVTSPEPMLGFFCALTRLTMNGQAVGAAEAVSFAEALRAYTIHGAYAAGLEGELGSIEPGKLADLAVFEPDLGALDPAELRRARPVLTVVGGRILYRR